MGTAEILQYMPGLTMDQVPRVLKLSDPTQEMPGGYIDFTRPNSTDLMVRYFNKYMESGAVVSWWISGTTFMRTASIPTA